MIPASSCACVCVCVFVCMYVCGKQRIAGLRRKKGTRDTTESRAFSEGISGELWRCVGRCKLYAASRLNLDKTASETELSVNRTACYSSPEAFDRIFRSVLMKRCTYRGVQISRVERRSPGSEARGSWISRDRNSAINNSCNFQLKSQYQLRRDLPLLDRFP